MTRLASFAALLLVGCGAPTVPSSPTADLRELVTFLRDVHPRLHRYVSPAELDARLEEEIVRLETSEEELDDLEVGRAFHRVLAPIGDSHLAVALPVFQRDSAIELALLPLMPIRIGERFFVDASRPELPAGTEVRAIEGRAIRELWDALAELVMVDGARGPVREAELERRFARYVHLELGARDEYRVRLRLPDGQEHESVLQGVGREELAVLEAARRSSPLRGGVDDPTQPAWPRAAVIDERTVVLRMPSFGITDQEGYRARVDAFFATLEGTETLVLDLRGNEGGFRTNGIAVLNHLLGRDYVQWTRMETRVRSIAERHRARVEFPYVPEDALTSFAGQLRDGRYVRDGDPLAALMRPVGAPHAGRVALFVDGATNSAAVELVAALLAHREGVVVIGRETGGECGRHVGEIPVAYATARRSIKVLVSLAELTHVAVEGCAGGRGFVPDVEVTYTEAHFIEGRDPFIEALPSE